MAIPYVVPENLPPVQLTPSVSVPDGFIRDPKNPRIITTLSDCLYDLRVNNHVRDELNGTWMRKYDEYKLPTGGYTRCIHTNTNGEWDEELNCDEEAVKAWMESAPGPDHNPLAAAIVNKSQQEGVSLATILLEAITNGDMVLTADIDNCAVSINAMVETEEEDDDDYTYEEWPDYEY